MLNELLIKELSEQVGINTSDIQSIKDAEVYSTSEVKTNKIWINGKPIYRKAIQVQPPNAVSHGIKNANFISISGFYKSNSSTTVFPIPSQRVGYPEYRVGVYVNDTQIIFDCGTGTFGSGYVILEYTKTTD